MRHGNNRRLVLAVSNDKLFLHSNCCCLVLRSRNGGLLLHHLLLLLCVLEHRQLLLELHCLLRCHRLLHGGRVAAGLHSASCQRRLQHGLRKRHGSGSHHLLRHDDLHCLPVGQLRWHDRRSRRRCRRSQYRLLQLLLRRCRRRCRCCIGGRARQQRAKVWHGCVARARAVDAARGLLLHLAACRRSGHHDLRNGGRHGALWLLHGSGRSCHEVARQRGGGLRGRARRGRPRRLRELRRLLLRRLHVLHRHLQRLRVRMQHVGLGHRLGLLGSVHVRLLLQLPRLGHRLQGRARAVFAETDQAKAAAQRARAGRLEGGDQNAASCSNGRHAPRGAATCDGPCSPCAPASRYLCRRPSQRHCPSPAW